MVFTEILDNGWVVDEFSQIFLSPSRYFCIALGRDAGRNGVMGVIFFDDEGDLLREYLGAR